MGMFDYLQCDWPLPEVGVVEGRVWQTKDGPCDMGLVRITADGKLLFESAHTDVVPDEERPYYGTDKWKEDSIWQMCGSMRRVVDATYEYPMHGDVHFYRYDGPGFEGEFHEYRARFTEGRLTSITKVEAQP